MLRGLGLRLLDARGKPGAMNYLKRLPNEPIAAFAALNASRAQGPKRCFKALSQELGRPVSTLRAWARRYNWLQRLDDYDTGLIDEQQRLEHEELKMRAADWARRQEEHREAEWQSSQRLMELVNKILKDPRFHLDPVSAMRCAEIASRLGRRACGMPLEPQPKQETWKPNYSFDVEAMLERAYGRAAERKAAAAADRAGNGMQPVIDV